MLMTNRRIFSLLTLLLVSSPIIAQDTLSLDQSFQELVQRSETYDIYKVIRSERLNSFWASVMDSVSIQKNTIKELQISLEEERGQAADYQRQSVAAAQQAQELQGEVNSIRFLAFQMEKGAYHTLVWLIIAVLIVLLGLLFWRFRESHQITSKARKDYEALSQDFEHHKEKARKKEVKLKRELQTAVNELEASKRGEV